MEWLGGLGLTQRRGMDNIVFVWYEDLKVITLITKQGCRESLETFQKILFK